MGLFSASPFLGRRRNNLRLVILILKPSSAVSDLNKADFPGFMLMLLLPRDAQAEIQVSLVLEIAGGTRWLMAQKATTRMMRKYKIIF